MATGYSFGALTEVLYPLNGGLSGNLDDYWGKDKAGVYYQNTNAGATTALNYPTTQAGVLEVIPHNANFIGASMQRYTVYSSNYVFVRSQDSGNRAWNAWRVQLNDLNLYNIIYPVGIGVWFSTAVNPNNVFSGTTWVQIVNGRSVRMATSAGTNVNTAGNIGNSGGADSIALAAANLPAHTHSMAHTHTMSHTHTMAHTHSMAHTHTVSGTTAGTDLGTKTVSNFDYGNKTAASAGDHNHGINASYGDADTNAVAGGDIAKPYNVNTKNGGAHTHVVAIGAHNHTVVMGSHTHTWSGTTSASSAANTGGVSVANTGGTDTANTGASSAANTGSVGNGTSFSVTGIYIYQAYWIRTA